MRFHCLIDFFSMVNMIMTIDATCEGQILPCYKTVGGNVGKEMMTDWLFHPPGSK